MELKESDKKLLACLDYMDRSSISKIAKVSGLTRKQVDYKLKKYQKEGIIRRFVTNVDYSKFGYFHFVILLLKFNKSSNLSLIKEKLKGDGNCMSFGDMIGKYDLCINLIFKDYLEIDNYLNKIITNEENNLLDYYILRPYMIERYPRKFLWDKIKKEKNILMQGNNSTPRKFDKIEIGILKILEKNGRERIIDIAKKLNISSELAIYKLKKLYSDKVILGTKIVFNMDKLSFFYSGALIHIKNPSEKIKREIVEFARKSPYIDGIMFSLSKPNCYIQFFHKSEKELRDTILLLKEKLKDYTWEIDPVFFYNQDYNIHSLPFLKS